MTDPVQVALLQPDRAAGTPTADHDVGDVKPPLRSRLRAFAAAAGATIMGAAPHVLHHIGPLAGAAILAGATGRILFAALGFLMTIPMLRRIHRHTGSWAAPTGALAVMSALFALSSFVIGPALTGSSGNAEVPASTSVNPADPSSQPADHEAHHVP